VNRNVELKVRCRDLEAVRRRAERLGARDAGILVQRDTFFAGARARLKLRVIEGAPAELPPCRVGPATSASDLGAGRLIAYERPDVPEARTSRYQIARVEDPEAVAAVLSQALGTCGIVRKRRRLYVHRHTRIHLDEVDGLGTFVELETVVSGQPEDEAKRELAEVAEALALLDEERIAVPYVVLLAADSR
jgi:adenylate cyclase class IV